MKYFRTVNHAKVIWNPRKKTKGITGGHLNLQSILSKSDQIQHLFMDSNLDFLALTETWLTSHTPTSMIDVSGYTFRKTVSGKGGGVLVYIRNIFKCDEANLDTFGLECLILNVVLLLPKINFNIASLFTIHLNIIQFYQDFDNLLKGLNHRFENILLGDFNINWLNKKQSAKTLNDYI